MKPRVIKRNRTSPPTWIRDGARVVFRPPAPLPPQHGIVAGDPWLSARGQWLVRVQDLRQPGRPDVAVGTAVVDVASIERRE